MSEAEQAVFNEGYDQGRQHEFNECSEMLAWAYRKLEPYNFSKLEDALMMDRIKLTFLRGC